MKTIYLIFIVCFSAIILIPNISYSQETKEYVKNPSFEDNPRIGTYYYINGAAKINDIKGWYDCGILIFSEETAPDIHGVYTEYWNVDHYPSHGETFLGLSVRDNDTWESVSQELKYTLEKGKCYSFTIDLGMSKEFKSPSRLSNKNAIYNSPVILAIWGGATWCNQDELLYESTPVSHEDWQTYKILLQPQSDLKYLTIKATFIDEDNPNNGNILVDNITSFTTTGCKE